MGQQTKIEWCDATFNPWRGCTKVSPGCTNCYAEKLSHRNPNVLGEWGPNGTRVIASESMWRQPIKWNAEAEAAGERRRVFCASLADVFEDRPELIRPRERLFALIRDTPYLDWLLLTKRPENAATFMDDACWPESGCPMFGLGDPLPLNAWLGVSVEDRQRADERIPELLKIKTAVRFLSVEPLLGPVDLDPWMRNRTGIDWVIIGGESGPRARPCYVAHVRSLVSQCRACGVPVFVKQLGGNAYEVCGSTATRIKLGDSKGGDWSEWPEDLRIRQFPR